MIMMLIGAAVGFMIMGLLALVVSFCIREGQVKWPGVSSWVDEISVLRK